MKITVTAEAWISVSRSGHWTRFSSAQQEIKNADDRGRAGAPAARRAPGGASRTPCARCSRSRLLRAAGAAADLVRAGASAAARRPACATARERGAGARALRRSSVARRLGGVAVVSARPSARRGSRPPRRAPPRSRRRSPAPGCRCWARVSASRERSASRAARCSRAFAARPFAALASSPSLVSARSARLLVRGVAPAPVAVLAQLDAVGRVPPRLVGLVVAPLAFLAGERDGDSNVSAGHWLVVLPLFGSGGRRSGAAYHPPQKKDPAPRLRRGSARWAKDSAPQAGAVAPANAARRGTRARRRSQRAASTASRDTTPGIANASRWQRPSRPPGLC